jgi:hypothetical protein
MYLANIDDEDYLRRLRAAGFAEAKITSSKALPQDSIDEWAGNAENAAALAKATSCCGPNSSVDRSTVYDIAGKIVSAQITALKAA